MNNKKIFYAELAYILGIFALAIGTALMERANFGMSMVVAPAYIIHLKLVQRFSFFSFGMAEYCLQAVLLIVLALISRKVKLKYLFSFGTAIFYGVTLDFAIRLISFIPQTAFIGRIVFFVVGMLFCSTGVSLLFHTYISPEAYELFVKEVSEDYGKEIHKVKTIYDCCSCIVSIILSFAFFGFLHFEGVSYGTVITALFNGTLIGLHSKYLEKRFSFEDGLSLRRVFD